jgi:predicted PurR-regulated permease PerM
MCLAETPAMRHVHRWLTFAGVVLIVAVLNWAQVVLVPLSLAILITFVLTPPVAWLQRRVGRAVAVFTVVALVFTGLGLAGYGVYRQMLSLGEALPGYRTNIREKIRDVRGAQSGPLVGKLSRTIEEIRGDLGTPAPPSGTPPKQTVVVASEPAGAVSGITWIGPFLEPVATAGLVIALVLFMLLDREALRDRIVGLFGRGHVAVMTKAMEEAGKGVSRQLLLQTIVNALYGAMALTGLYLLGVPYPLFWGALGAALRFIPYVGPLIAAVGPILLAAAALPGWAGPAGVAAFYVALELFTNLVLETVLAAGAAGISEVALLVAVAFWTWLWGPLGLLMATPLTVCIIVVGKHVPGLDRLGILLSDAPALSAEHSYYQRVLARDEADASELVDRFVASQPPDAVYDGLLLPALNFAERDRFGDRLSADEEAAVVDTTREMMAMLDDVAVPVASGTPLKVLGYPVNGLSDELALRMLQKVSARLPLTFEMASPKMLASEVVALVERGKYDVVCLADLPPSPPSKTRYLVRRLRSTLPDVRLAVGRWAPRELADDTLQPLTDAGASHVATTILETLRYLSEAAHVGTPVPEELPGRNAEPSSNAA